MIYIKNCFLIAMLLGVGYSECNESNWQSYYPNMQGCDLEGQTLLGKALEGQSLKVQ